MSDCVDVFELCTDYHRLDARRADIDECIVELPPDDPRRDVLWDELESVLGSVRKVLMSMTTTPANHTSDLSAKAATLGALLRSADAGCGPIVPQHLITAFALSVTDDIAGLLDCQRA
jgi:hypothetical protein